MKTKKIISPEFQRLFRWDIIKRTKFIESVILGIPIPPIFVAEDNDGKWELVDGLQRISTILSFFGKLADDNPNNGWVLDSGSLVNTLQGYDINTLPEKYVRNIKRAYCRVEIIKWDSKYDMRYELFNRLNTGGEPLTDQEIRNCIFRGTSDKFNNLLKELVIIDGFRTLVGISESKINELFDEELVLRFFSLFYSDLGEIAEKNISELMTSFMKKTVEDPTFPYDEAQSFFTRTISLLSKYGSQIFKFENGQFSTSLYDAITVGIAQNIDVYENQKSEDVLTKITGLKELPEFRKYIGAAASSKSRLINRMKVTKEYFLEG